MKQNVMEEALRSGAPDAVMDFQTLAELIAAQEEYRLYATEETDREY